MSPLLTGVFASQISGHLIPPYAGPTGAFDALASFTVPSGGIADVTFAGIPQGYKHLQLRITAKYVNNTEVDIQFNGDTGSNYYSHFIEGNGSAASSNKTTPYTQAYLGWQFGTARSSMIVDILDYANTSKYKVTKNWFGYDENTRGEIMYLDNLWQSTNAITSIRFFGGVNIDANSTISLYGVK